MVDKNTDFFRIVDNFAKTASVSSTQIIKSELNFIPKVTIAIPTFRRASLLKETIDSAINQIDYTDYDILVVDNNPERGCETETLLKSYNNPRLSYYKNNENIMMIGNWNRLFTLAKGKYVVMLHDDDLLFPNFLKVCMSLVETNNADLIKPLAYEWRSNEVQLSILSDCNVMPKLKRVYDISNYYGNALGAPTGCLFKKKNVIELGGFNQEYYPSSDFCFEILYAKHYKCYRLLNVLYVYRLLENESLNKITLDNTIKHDFYLHTQLLNRYYVPNKIIKKILSYKFSNVIKINRIMWRLPAYNFDLKTLGLSSDDKYIGFLLCKFLKIYVCLCQMYFKYIIQK